MPHPAAMDLWDSIGCTRGCEDHPTRTVHIVLGGPTAYHDYTPIPNRFACEFDLDVWNTDITPVDHGSYCPARDSVSETILSHGVWEPQETTVLLLCWEALYGVPGRKVWFIDIGSQIGWFSVLAASGGVHTLAFEADSDVARLCQKNMDRYGSVGSVANVRVGPDTFPFAPADSDIAAVAKIDIEGAERYAVEMLRPLVNDGSLRFILMEMSPCFGPSYPGIAEDLIASGYQMYTLPPKQLPPVKINRLSDLIPYEVTGDVGAEVVSWDQRDVLFALGGIEP